MTKTIHYRCEGTCSRELEIIYDDSTNKITDFVILGGCNGNLKGIRALILNRDLNEVHDLLKGIRCNSKSTSCPDQIARAIETINN